MILADFQVNGQFPSKIATSGAGPVYFPRTFGTTFNVTPATPTTTNFTGQLNLPGSQYFNAVHGQRLRLVAAGSVWTAASGTVQIIVNLNTGSLTTVTLTPVMQTAATTVNGRASWFLEGHMVIAGNASLSTDNGTGSQLNSGSPAPLVQGQMSGSYIGELNQTLIDLTGFNAGGAVPTVTLINTASGTSPNVSGFAVSVTYGTPTAGNNATLNEFAILGD